MPSAVAMNTTLLISVSSPAAVEAAAAAVVIDEDVRWDGWVQSGTLAEKGLL